MKLKGIQVNVKTKEVKEVFEEIDDAILQEQIKRAEAERKKEEALAKLKELNRKKIRALADAILTGDKAWLKKYEQEAEKHRRALKEYEIQDNRPRGLHNNSN